MIKKETKSSKITLASMRLNILGILLGLVLLLGVDGNYVLGLQDVNTIQFPSWLKSSAKGWHDGYVNDSSFMQLIQYFIQEDIIQKLPTTSTSNLSTPIPKWIKNNAGWWADDQISNTEFVNGIQYLIQKNVINVTSSVVVKNTSQKYLALFTPKVTPDLLVVLEKHIQSDDVISSFNPNVLNKYSIQKALLAYSIDTVKTAIQTAKSNPKTITYIGYDNEENNGNLSTPSVEVKDPAGYTNIAADLVHQAGYKFACMPTKALLLQEYQQVNWSKVDLLIMQMQKFTTDETTFTDIVTKVATFAKSQNPKLIIFVQVNPAFDTNEHITKMVSNVSSKIDGTSIVVIGTPPSTIDTLVTSLGR